MNENIYNGQFNLICSDGYNIDFDIPKNCNIVRNNVQDATLDIRQYELDNDEIFSGNLILKQKADLNVLDIFKKCSVDDNSVYVIDYCNSQHNKDCNIDESVIYCGSLVLWLFGQYHRNDLSLFHSLRRNRIILRRFKNYGL
jgi:hypothetical protein|tara:strand:- start:157 stop:582 length:426 start_codon:yes stop_codon:yes gene_type:complete